MIPRKAVLEAGDALLPIARDRDGPIFNEAWEAQAFAMVVALHEAKLFSWSEWTAALAREIAAGPPPGDADDSYCDARQFRSGRGRVGRKSCTPGR